MRDGCFETVTRRGGAGRASWKQSSNSKGVKRTAATKAKAIEDARKEQSAVARSEERSATGNITE